MTKPSVRTWDFSALNREHGWAWPWEHTVSESMIFGPLAPAVSRRGATRDVRPEHDLLQLRRDLPVLPLAAYDVWEPGTNPRHLLKTFREIVTEIPDARPWETLRELYHYPEELCLARGPLAHLVVQESGFVRRGDVAANIVIAIGHRRGMSVASVGDPDGRTGGLATYNTVAVGWRGENLSRTMWVIKREHGRPGWSMIPELWREFIAGAQQERRSMMAPLAESLAIAIQRAAVRDENVPLHVLESANHWQDVVEELLTMKNTETEEEGAPAWAGFHGGSAAADTAKANERLAARIIGSRKKRQTTVRRASKARSAQPFESVDIDTEVLTAQGEEISALKVDLAAALERVAVLERESVTADEFGKLVAVVSDLHTAADTHNSTLDGLGERLAELAKAVEDLREDLATEETEVPDTTG